MLPQLHESFVGDVFSRLRVSYVKAQKTPQPTHLASIKTFEALDVTLAQAVPQLSVREHRRTSSHLLFASRGQKVRLENDSDRARGLKSPNEGGPSPCLAAQAGLELLRDKEASYPVYHARTGTMGTRGTHGTQFFRLTDQGVRRG